MEMYADELGKTDKILYTIIYNEYGFLSANPVPYVKLQMAKLSEFPNKGLIITVSPNHSMGFIESIARLVMKFMGLNLKKGVFVRTMDEAIARIHMEEQNAEVA